jgi:integrase
VFAVLTERRSGRPSLSSVRNLFVVLGAMGDRLKDLRDRALLLIGFAGGLRRSELAAINLSDFERVREGIVLTIRRSKTDQYGVGRKIGKGRRPLFFPSPCDYLHDCNTAHSIRRGFERRGLASSGRPETT